MSTQQKENLPINPKTGKAYSIFDQYKMFDDIKHWRMSGLSYKRTLKKVKEKYKVNPSYTALYAYCVSRGLDGDMSGTRATTINTYEKLLDGIAINDKAIAVSQVALEEVEEQIQSGDLDSKMYSAIMASVERQLSRRESLLKSLTEQQDLIYRYINVSKLVDRMQEIVVEKGGLDVWNTIWKAVKGDFMFRELLSKIPQDKVKTVLKEK